MFWLFLFFFAPSQSHATPLVEPSVALEQSQQPLRFDQAAPVNPYALHQPNRMTTTAHLMRSTKQAAITAHIGGASTLLFGVLSAATTGEMVPSLPFGSIALLSTMITAPIAATAAQRSRHYIMARGGYTGVSGFAIAGWTVYALAVVNGSALVALGAADAYVSPGLIISCTLLGVSATSFMAADAFSMRRQVAHMQTSRRGKARKFRMGLQPEIGAKSQKVTLVGTF